MLLSPTALWIVIVNLAGKQPLHVLDITTVCNSLSYMLMIHFKQKLTDNGDQREESGDSYGRQCPRRVRLRL